MDIIPANLILRSEVMKAILSGQPFSMSFVTADRRRGTGGELICVKNWMKVRQDIPEDNKPGNYASKFTRAKEANNYSNRTFLIYNPAKPAEHPVRVHFRLIDVFNGKKVING